MNIMEKRMWYAAQRDRLDDWGTGSYDLAEALEIARRIGAELIAEIDEAAGVCVGEMEV